MDIYLSELKLDTDCELWIEFLPFFPTSSSTPRNLRSKRLERISSRSRTYWGIPATLQVAGQECHTLHPKGFSRT